MASVTIRVRRGGKSNALKMTAWARVTLGWKTTSPCAGPDQGRDQVAQVGGQGPPAFFPGPHASRRPAFVIALKASGRPPPAPLPANC